MTQTEEIFELKEELERVKLLLQKCNGDIVRADRELKSERNKAIDDCIQVLENNPGDMNLVPLLESLKL